MDEDDYQNEEELDEQEEMNEGDDYLSTPKKSLKVSMKKAASAPLHSATKTVGKGIGSAIKKGTKSFIIGPKLKFFIVLGIVLIVFIAIIIFVIIDADAATVTDSATYYVNNSDSLNDDTKYLFNSKGSAILVPVKDINAMYEEKVNKENSSGNSTTATRIQREKYGDKDISDSSFSN